MYSVITSFTTSSAGIIDITNIPTTFKNLRLLITTQISVQNLNPYTLRPNASTATQTGYLYYYDQSNTGENFTSHTTYPMIGGRWYDSFPYGCFDIDIFDYSQTDKYKVIQGIHTLKRSLTSGDALMRVANGRYASNTAITRLYLPETYAAGTQVVLLGTGVK